MPRTKTDPADIAIMFATNNSRWGRQNGAKGECYLASVRMDLVMCARGIKSKIIHADSDGAEHYAVLVGDTVYDLTARQFDETADFPLVISKQAWVGFVSLALDHPVRITTKE